MLLSAIGSILRLDFPLFMRLMHGSTEGSEMRLLYVYAVNIEYPLWTNMMDLYNLANYV